MLLDMLLDMLLAVSMQGDLLCCHMRAPVPPSLPSRHLREAARHCALLYGLLCVLALHEILHEDQSAILCSAKLSWDGLTAKPGNDTRCVRAPKDVRDGLMPHRMDLFPRNLLRPVNSPKPLTPTKLCIDGIALRDTWKSARPVQIFITASFAAWTCSCAAVSVISGACSPFLHLPPLASLAHTIAPEELLVHQEVFFGMDSQPQTSPTMCVV